MNSSDAEQSVIGGLLIDPNVKQIKATGLLPSDFSDKNLGHIYQYLIDMDNEDEKIDALSVRDYIDREGNHSGAWTGFPYLVTLAENCPSVANIDIYASHIRTTRISNEIEVHKNKIKYSNYQDTVDKVQKLQSDLSDVQEDGMQSIVSKTID